MRKPRFATEYPEICRLEIEMVYKLGRNKMGLFDSIVELTKDVVDVVTAPIEIVEEVKEELK